MIEEIFKVEDAKMPTFLIEKIRFSVDETTDTVISRLVKIELRSFLGDDSYVYILPKDLLGLRDSVDSFINKVIPPIDQLAHECKDE